MSGPEEKFALAAEMFESSKQAWWEAAEQTEAKGPRQAADELSKACQAADTILRTFSLLLYAQETMPENKPDPDLFMGTVFKILGHVAMCLSTAAVGSVVFKSGVGVEAARLRETNTALALAYTAISEALPQ
jgi:hypothetical protein